MRTRLVDVLLMAGLFLVGAAILWTLFTLGNDRSRPDPADNPPAASAPADDGGAGEVEPLPPGDADTEGGGSDASGASDAPTGDGVGAEGANGTTDAAGTDAIGTPDPDENDVASEVEPVTPVVPGEPVALQRVGFSFTTGGAGACGIVLEPWEHVAVSRDVLATYGCGTEITLELADETAGRTQVELVIADTMNEQFSRTANIYVAPDEPALAYGVTEGTLVP